MLEVLIIRDFLIENVGKLVMHRMEIILVHRSIILQSLICKTVHHIESDYQSTLCRTENHCSFTTVIGCRAYQVDYSRHIFLYEIGADTFCIGIKPKILSDDSQLCRLCRICRNKVVFHIAVDVFHFIFEVYIIRISIVSQQPFIEIITLYRLVWEDTLIRGVIF